MDHPAAVGRRGRRGQPRGRNRLAALLLLVLAAVGAGTLLAPSAVAHADLVASDPAEGTELPAPPTTVTLTFSEAVQTDFAQVAVLDAGGADVSRGEPQVVGETVTQAVGVGVAGAYTVSYRVVSADGHPVTGELAFTVAAGGGPPPESAAPSAPAAADPSSGTAATPSFDGRLVAATDDDEGSGLSGWAWVGIGVALVAGAGGALAVALRPGAGGTGAPRTASTTEPTTDGEQGDAPER